VNGAWQRPLSGTFGDTGRDSLYGPRFSQTDLSIFKQFQPRENIKVQFRCETFNLFNHTNLGQPTACVDCPGTAGRIFATAAAYMPPTFQMALRIEF
jgi:hypothetical protein